MSTHMRTALASRLLRIAFAVLMLTACVGCGHDGPWQVPGDSTVLVGENEYAMMHGVNIYLLSGVISYPRWITVDDHRAINGLRVVREAKQLADRFGVERDKMTFNAAADRVLGGAFHGDSRIRGVYNKTIVLFSLEPLAGVVIRRPIIDRNRWSHGRPTISKSIVTSDGPSQGRITLFSPDIEGIRVLPNGVFVATDFGPYRPEAWFIDGMPGPARPFDETGDAVTISHGRYAYLIKLDGDRWVVECAGEAGS